MTVGYAFELFLCLGCSSNYLTFSSRLISKLVSARDLASAVVFAKTFAVMDFFPGFHSSRTYEKVPSYIAPVVVDFRTLQLSVPEALVPSI